MKKGWIPDKIYKSVYSGRRYNAKAVLAEKIKKSDRQVIVFTKDGLISGEEWLKKYEEENI